MSGQQLLQAVDLQPQHGAGLLDREDRATEFFGVHLLSLLGREQAALRASRTALGLQDLQEFGAGLATNLAQAVFGQGFVRLVSRWGR